MAITQEKIEILVKYLTDKGIDVSSFNITRDLRWLVEKVNDVRANEFVANALNNPEALN